MAGSSPWGAWLAAVRERLRLLSLCHLKGFFGTTHHGCIQNLHRIQDIVLVTHRALHFVDAQKTNYIQTFTGADFFKNLKSTNYLKKKRKQVLDVLSKLKSISRLKILLKTGPSVTVTAYLSFEI